jgi:phosphoribosyl 1,2-cyclic phosphodiesterase
MCTDNVFHLVGVFMVAQIYYQHISSLDTDEPKITSLSMNNFFRYIHQRVGRRLMPTTNTSYRTRPTDVVVLLLQPISGISTTGQQRARHALLMASSSSLIVAVSALYLLSWREKDKNDDLESRSIMNSKVGVNYYTSCDPTLSEPSMAVPRRQYQKELKKGSNTALEDNHNNNTNHNDISIDDDRPRLIFLGTGSSTGCPKPICTLTYAEAMRKKSPRELLSSSLPLTLPSSSSPSSYSHNKEASISMSSSIDSSSDLIAERLRSNQCHVSNRAIQGDPKNNKDYRNNPCLLIHHHTNSDNDESDDPSAGYRNIIIDVGKTFRETALRWLPHYGITSLDAIVLTHHHMDAAAGLDDVRGFQKLRWVPIMDDSRKNNATNNREDGNNDQKLDQVEVPTKLLRPGREPVPLYMSNFCHTNLQSQFPWLLPRSDHRMPQQAQDRPTVIRDVASFDVTIFQDYKQQIVKGTEDFHITPLPVWHGDDLISHGFAFTLYGKRDSTKDATKKDTVTSSISTIDTDNGRSNRNAASSSSLTSSSSTPSLNVVYLSDISRMVPETLEYIQTQLPPTDILIVDSLLWDTDHPVHFSLKQAVDLAETIQPRIRTYLIGMSCDNFLPHTEMNAYLNHRYGEKILMAHDGLTIDVPTQKDVTMSDTRQP